MAPQVRRTTGTAMQLAAVLCQLAQLAFPPTPGVVINTSALGAPAGRGGRRTRIEFSTKQAAVWQPSQAEVEVFGIMILAA